MRAWNHHDGEDVVRLHSLGRREVAVERYDRPAFVLATLEDLDAVCHDNQSNVGAARKVVVALADTIDDHLRLAKSSVVGAREDVGQSLVVVLKV